MASIPISKVEQTVTIIREAIQRGEWEGNLPSERSLAEELMVSRGCLRLALDALVELGVIAKAEPYKRRKILIQSESPTKNKLGKVVFFSPEPADKASPTVLVQIATLRSLLIKSDIVVEMVSSPVFKQAHPSEKKLEQVIKDHTNAVWVLHQANEKIQQWFSDNKLPALIFGSRFPSANLPSLDIDMKGVSRHATGMLLAKGHKKICLLRFRSSLAGDDLAEEGMKEALLAHADKGVHPPIVLRHNFHVERLCVLLDQTFASANPPTALVVINPHHFLASFTHLQTRGVKFPEHVSTISLSDDVLLDYVCPRPVSYSVESKLIQKLAKMVLRIASGRKDEGSQYIIPEVVAGQTVAEARK